MVGPIVIFGGYGDGGQVNVVGNILKYTPGMCSLMSGGSGTRGTLVWRYNVMSGGTCGAGDRNGSYGYRDQNNDLHLASGAPAVDGGEPASYPAGDIDGTSRPTAGVPDAGPTSRDKPFGVSPVRSYPATVRR